MLYLQAPESIQCAAVRDLPCSSGDAAPAGRAADVKRLAAAIALAGCMGVCGCLITAPIWGHDVAAAVHVGTNWAVVLAFGGLATIAVGAMAGSWSLAAAGVVATVIGGLGLDDGAIPDLSIAIIPCVMLVAWVLQRMINDQARPVADCRGNYLFARPEQGCVVIHTNLPRSNELASIIGGATRNGVTPDGVTEYILTPSRMDAERAARVINERAAMVLRKPATGNNARRGRYTKHSSSDYPTIRDTDGGLGGREL